MGGHTGATWRIRLNLCFLRSTRVHNPNGKLIGSAVSAQFMAESPFTLQWTTFSPRIAPSRGGSGLHLTRFLEPDRPHSPNGISIGSAVFAQMTAECPYTLQLDAPFPSSKLPLPMGGSGTPSNTWFPGPTQVINPNGISISSAILAGLTSVTDRQTDRPRYSVGNNKPHLRT